GRWLSPDPYAGSMDVANPQSLNRYSYAGNNPLNITDPSGLLWNPLSHNISGNIDELFGYASFVEEYIIAFSHAEDIADECTGNACLSNPGNAEIDGYGKLHDEGSITVHPSDWDDVFIGILVDYGLSRSDRRDGELRAQLFNYRSQERFKDQYLIKPGVTIGDDFTLNGLQLFQALVGTDPEICGSGGGPDAMHVPETKMQQTSAAYYGNTPKAATDTHQTREISGTTPTTSELNNAHQIELGNRVVSPIALVGNAANCAMAH
ncbi:MAG TPA: RHS repeat-associated core domain-containing protein, partial [Candidatus Angelobacter sp.]